MSPIYAKTLIDHQWGEKRDYFYIPVVSPINSNEIKWKANRKKTLGAQIVLFRISNINSVSNCALSKIPKTIKSQ